MLATHLASQMKQPGQAWRMRYWAIIALGILAAGWFVLRPAGPADSMGLVAGTQLILAVLVAGAVTGWRVTQLPKSRAAEFFLICPVSDWEIVGGEILSGMLRSAFLLSASAPLVCFLWGAGWIDLAQAAALLLVPPVVGWAIGISIAVVAYEPLWVRRWGERLVLVMILAYLVGFGLGGAYLVPLVNSWWTRLTGFDIKTTLAFISPMRLLDTRGQEEMGALLLYVAAVVLLVTAVSALGVWRLVVRLREHYLEELFGQQRSKKDYLRPVGENPLSWWTIRRVSRFRGHVNLYLGWTTILLFSAWLLAGDRWPPWLGFQVMLIFEYLGGAAMLGAFAIQFGLVPGAFLSGLWDSNAQLRIGRLELLLASPLEPRQFLLASAAAVWTRAKGYFLAAIVVWLAAAAAGRITWLACLAVMLLSANYILLFFAIAFRGFARIAGDRVAATWGFALAIGWPASTCILLFLGWVRAAALTPLGAVYFLARPAAEQVQRSGLSQAALWTMVAAASLCYFVLSLWLLHRALATFEFEIRDWFGRNLAPPKAKRKPVTPAAVPAETVLEAS